MNPFKPKFDTMLQNISISSALALLFVLSILASCGSGTERTAEEEVRHNVLTEEEKADGWELLFDGRTTRGWRGFQKTDLTMDEGWFAHQGTFAAAGTGSDLTGDIVTERKFSNFIFETEWRISEGGNSGIFYLVGEKNYPAIYTTGPEYQLLDDLGYPENLENWHLTGANYGMHAPRDAPVKPAGEWNHTRITVNNGHVEHWLNGTKVVEYQMWTDEWKKLVASGKWAKYPEYGSYREGHIGLQDHGDRVWFRNMKVKELD
jgi:hypothetical protein